MELDGILLPYLSKDRQMQIRRRERDSLCRGAPGCSCVQCIHVCTASEPSIGVPAFVPLGFGEAALPRIHTTCSYRSCILR